MPEVSRQQKITFGEMRESGVDHVLIYCADHKCSHSIELSADRWADDVRLSDVEDQFVLQGLREARRRRPAEFRACRGWPKPRLAMQRPNIWK
jgi:hypothetical protein